MGAGRRSWTDQAVGSVRTTACRRRTPPGWCAPPRRRRPARPSDRRRAPEPRGRPPSLGRRPACRGSGRSLGVTVVGSRARQSAPAAGPPASRGRPGRPRRRGVRPAAWASDLLIRRARSRPSSSCPALVVGWSGSRRRPHVVRRRPGQRRRRWLTAPSRTSYRTPASAAGTSAATAAVTSTCSAPRDQLAEVVAAFTVELGEDVVQWIKIGSSPSARRRSSKPAATRVPTTTFFAMRRRHSGRAASASALPSDQRHSSADAPPAGRSSSSWYASALSRTRPQAVSTSPSPTSKEQPVLHLGVLSAKPGHGLVGLADVRAQRVDQREPRGEEPSADRELLVPDVPRSRARPGWCGAGASRSSAGVRCLQMRS